MTVLGVQRDQVHLGFTGPAEVSIHREDIWMRIQRQIMECVVRRSAT
jgi:carbon storage regulator CsrA